MGEHRPGMLQKRPDLYLCLHGAFCIGEHLFGDRRIHIPRWEDPLPEGNDIMDRTIAEFRGLVALAHVNAVGPVNVKVPFYELAQGLHFRRRVLV